MESKFITLELAGREAE